MLAAGEKGTAKEQYRNAQKAAQLMVEIIKKGYELIIFSACNLFAVLIIKVPGTWEHLI